MGANIAVSGCELEDETGGGTVNITSSASDKVLAGGSGVYFGDVAISVSGSDGGGDIGDGNGAGTGTITGTGENVDGGGPALLEGDTAKVTVTGTTTSGQVVTHSSAQVTVKVTKAGQKVVIAL